MLKSLKSLNFIYFILFVFFLLFFMVVQLPLSSIEKRIAVEIEKKSPFPVVIESLDFNLPASFSLRNVILVTKRETQVKIDEINIKVGLFSLLTSNRLEVPFGASLYDGSLVGSLFYLKDKNRVERVEVNIDSINSAPLPGLLSGDNSFAVDGKISGNIMVNLANGNRRPKVVYFINSDNLGIKVSRLNRIKFEDEYRNLKAELRGTISSLSTNIENLSFINEDFKLRFHGKVPTPWKVRKGSKINLTMDLRLFSPKAKLAMLKAFLSPQRNGSLKGRILGTVSKPKLVKIKTRLIARL